MGRESAQRVWTQEGVDGVGTSLRVVLMWGSWGGVGGVRVAEGEGQGRPRRLLVALAQEADELGLEHALQEAVGGVLLQDEEVILPGAGQVEGGK